MNKPIRTISIFCLLLFLALMINATYLQYYQAGALEQDPRNRRVLAASFSGDRGAILVGREAVAESVTSDDQYEFQRRYPQPFKYSHVTGWFSYFSQTGIEQSQNDVLSGDDSLLFVTRLVDLLSNSTPKGGSVQLTLDPAAQDAAFEGLEALPGEAQGAVVALEPSTGKILAMVVQPQLRPQPDGEPRLRRRRRHRPSVWVRTESEPLLNRAIQTTLPPGSTFKIVTAAAALESGNYADSDALVPGGPTYQLPLTSGESGVMDNGGRACGTDRIPMIQAMEQSCNTSFAPLADELGPEAMREQAEAFGWNCDVPRGPAPAGGVRLSRRTWTRPRRHCPASGSSSVTATPLQMAMVVAAVANGGIVMQPYLVDEVRSPELDVLDKTEPEDALRGRSPPPPPRSSRRCWSPRSTTARRARPPSRASRSAARPAPPRAAAPTSRRTPGSCRSRPPTTRRSRSR